MDPSTSRGSPNSRGSREISVVHGRDPNKRYNGKRTGQLDSSPEEEHVPRQRRRLEDFAPNASKHSHK